MILTFDLGTTRLKVAAFDASGTLLGQIARRNIEHGQDDRRWQSADQWWQHCIEATRLLFHQHHIDPKEIAGCSLSGRAGAAIFLDKNGKVLIDPWSDMRHSSQLARLQEERDRRDVSIYAATLISKYLWARQHCPRLAEQTRYLLYAKDLILYRLTGEAVTDPASGPDALTWDEELLQTFEIPAELLPQPALPWQVGGAVTMKAADELGLRPGIPVAVGAHDGICANAGAGAITDGQCAITLGTNIVARAVSSKVPSGSRRFYGFPPDKHIIGGNAWLAGRAPDWFIDNWFHTPEEDRQQQFATLNRHAAEIPPGANGVLFLPFPGGQIAPERRPNARAAFHGLAMDITPAAIYRAILEGSGFALAQVFRQVTSWTGEPTYIGVTGSGANSEVWTRIIADILKQPLNLTDGAAEGRGAAMFCAVASNDYNSLAEAAAGMVRVSARIEPQSTNVYGEVQARWQAFYEATRRLDA